MRLRWSSCKRDGWATSVSRGILLMNMPRSLSSSRTTPVAATRKTPRPSRSRATGPSRVTPVKRPSRTVDLSVVDASASYQEEQEMSREPQTVSFQEGILDPHHKRRLIHAHATARKARHVPHHQWLTILGITTACLVLIGGWWLTMGPWMKGQLIVKTEAGFTDQVRQETLRMEQKYGLSNIETPSFEEALRAATPVESTGTEPASGDR